MATDVEERFRGPLVLDGGMATELERGGADLRDALWSARLLKDDPGSIRRVHEAFFDAGADVAISASYQASFSGFADRGIEAEEAASLMRLQRGARSRSRRGRRIRSTGGGLGGTVRRHAGRRLGVSRRLRPVCGGARDVPPAAVRDAPRGRTRPVGDRDDPLDRRGRSAGDPARGLPRGAGVDLVQLSRRRMHQRRDAVRRRGGARRIERSRDRRRRELHAARVHPVVAGRRRGRRNHSSRTRTSARRGTPHRGPGSWKANGRTRARPPSPGGRRAPRSSADVAAPRRTTSARSPPRPDRIHASRRVRISWKCSQSCSSARRSVRRTEPID